MPTLPKECPHFPRACPNCPRARSSITLINYFVLFLSASTRLPSYQQTGTGNQDSYFGLQPEHGGSEWQAYGAYSQFGAAPSTAAAAVAVAGHLDTMLYGGPAPGDASGAPNYGSTPGGTPPVIPSPAPYSAAAAAAGAPGGGRGHGGLNR